MAAPYLLSTSHVVPSSIERAMAVLFDVRLEDLFTERGGLIPHIKETRGDRWSEVGDTRTVVLADGSTNTETLVGLERPTSYRYRLSDFTGPMRMLVERVDGEFMFSPSGDGTRATWSWAVYPKNGLTRLTMPLLGRSWRTFGDRMWPKFDAYATA